jgi:hypothetical protein
MGVNFFFRQHFGKAKTQPYVGGEIFVQDVKDSDTTYLDGIFGCEELPVRTFGDRLQARIRNVGDHAHLR